MCYYATTDYLCGDWKWGNMMLRCPRQHRIGETCGAKLVHHESITKSQSICKLCEEIRTKERRLAKTVDNILRWSREPDKFSAILERARREAGELKEKISDLHSRRPSIAMNMPMATRPISGGRNSTTPSLPPASSIAASTVPGYEYTSPASITRRQDSASNSHSRYAATPTTSGTHQLSPIPTGNQYANGASISYVDRNSTAGGGGSAHMQGGSSSVSYARR